MRVSAPSYSHWFVALPSRVGASDSVSLNGGGSISLSWAAGSKHGLTWMMPGIDTLNLRKAALALARGVGYCPHSNFIHVDIGRVRQWCFDCPATLMASD